MATRKKADAQQEGIGLRLGASEAARALRAIPSEARTEASRRNGRAGGRPAGFTPDQEARARQSEALREAWRRRKAEGTATGGGRAFQPLETFPCTCGRGDALDGHPTTCPRGRAIRRRLAAGKL